MIAAVMTFMILGTSLGLKIGDVIAYETAQQNQELTVEENLHGGKVLVLSDGSAWEVAPQDIKNSQLWILPSPLKIEKSDDPIYSYRITNMQTNSSILVRPI